ncbi:MAG: biopolymer transporter ExbD [Pseudomonadota bacterium]
MQSNRAKRMDRHHKRGKAAPLNLVSLMDIFTILVFFLLVNSSDVQTLPNAKDLQMPESIAEQKPRETVIVTITDDDVLLQGEKVVSVVDVANSKQQTIPTLQQGLEGLSSRLIQADNEDGYEVTIMGDKEIPYTLLKKVMATCTVADYRRISLAVMQRAPAEEAAG